MPHSFEELGLHTRFIRPSEEGEAIDPTLDIPNGDGVYGYQSKGYPRPELLAPRTEDTGGFLFLPGKLSEELIDELVEVAGMGSNKHYKNIRFGLQVIDAPEGMEADLGYMRKIVIADRFALRFLYKTLDESEYESFPEQPCDVAEATKAFVQSEQERFGLWFGSAGLAGKFGGDGYLGQETLGFGFAIENSYYKVISVWSRGWLCTK